MAAKSITMKQRFNVPLDQVFPVFNQHATFNTILWPIQSIVIKQSHDPDNADGVGSVRKMGVGPLKFIQEEITKIIPNQMIEYQMSLYTTNFTEPLSYQDSAFLKLPKFP